jgi:hypothetical protein
MWVKTVGFVASYWLPLGAGPIVPAGPTIEAGLGEGPVAAGAAGVGAGVVAA